MNKYTYTIHEYDLAPFLYDGLIIHLSHHSSSLSLSLPPIPHLSASSLRRSPSSISAANSRKN